MTELLFGLQMDRLRECFGPKLYEPIRIKLIWNAVRHQDDRLFEQAVTHCMQTLRSAPLVPELLKALESVIAQKKQLERESALHRVSDPISALLEAGKVNKGADKEFVQACLKLLQDKTNGKLNHIQFVEGCEYLDEAARWH